MNKVIEDKKGIIIKNAEDFDPGKTFGCGQCFRWFPQGGGYRGIAGGRMINVLKTGNDILLEGAKGEDDEGFWRSYFDMDRDYSKILKFLSKDPLLSEAAEFGRGIRILKQDFFECVISFIISANNNIPRIQGIIEKLCRMFGKKIKGDFYAFPSPSDMYGITENDLAPLRCGYRAGYLVRAVKAIASGEVDEVYIASLSYDKAKKELCKISGVGPKVADCILLFSLHRFDAFPADVWVKRVMHEIYGCDESDAGALGRKLYGDYAGIAQQYLYYWRRSKGLT